LRSFAFVDEAFAKQELVRRVALTVPDFAMGLATVAGPDLIASMPRRFVAMHARRFGLVSRELPVRTRKFAIRAIATKAAMMDVGLAWMFGVLREAVDGKYNGLQGLEAIWLHSSTLHGFSSASRHAAWRGGGQRPSRGLSWTAGFSRRGSNRRRRWRVASWIISTKVDFSAMARTSRRLSRALHSKNSRACARALNDSYKNTSNCVDRPNC
jgi:hypothetical protein